MHVPCILKQKGGKLKPATEKKDFFRTTYYLTSRSFTNMRRDLTYYWFRLLTYVGLAIVLGTMYYKVGLGYSAIQVILALKSTFRKATHFLHKKTLNIFLMITRYITSFDHALKYIWLLVIFIQARAAMLMFVASFMSFLGVLSFPCFIEDMKVVFSALSLLHLNP